MTYFLPGYQAKFALLELLIFEEMHVKMLLTEAKKRITLLITNRVRLKQKRRSCLFFKEVTTFNS